MASEAIELPKRPEIVRMQAVSGVFVDVIRRLPFNTYADSCESLIAELRADVVRGEIAIKLALTGLEAAKAESKHEGLTEALEAVRGVHELHLRELASIPNNHEFANCTRASIKTAQACESAVSRLLGVGK